MTHERFPSELLLLPVGLIVVRRTIGGQPIFRLEFVVEDFILLLTLICSVVPLRFKPVIWGVINCLISTTMTLLGWTTGKQKFPAMVLALLTICLAVLTLMELSKLRSDGLNGSPSP